MLSDEEGIIRSPNFPEDYEGGLDCKYFFNGIDNVELVEINFIHFELDTNFGQTDCQGDDIDYVAIYDSKVN